MKHLLPLDARKQFYLGLVQPLIDYCCCTWGNCCKDQLKKIHKSMKLFARAILNIKDAKSVRTIELFHRLNWLPIDYRIIFF